MTTLVLNAIQKEENQLISFTNIPGGALINEGKLNYQIAEAIMTAGNVESFGIGEVYFPEDLADLEGIVYKNGEVVIFIDFNKQTKKVDRIIVNQETETYPEHFLLQALIMLEIEKNTTGLNLKDYVLKVANLPKIEKDSDEANLLMKVTKAFEDTLESGNLHPLLDVVIDEEMELITVIDNKKSLGLTTKVATPFVEVEQVVEQVVEDVKELETTMEEEVYVEQLSFLDDEPSDENEEELDEAEEIAQMIQRENDHGTNLSKIAQIAGVSNGTVSKALNKGKVAPKSLNKIRDALAALQEDALDEIYEKVNGVLENPPMQKPRLGERILQKVAEPVKEKPKYTLDEMKNLRPLIWDDETVRDYLRQFDFIELKPFRTKEEFIDAVIAYRTEQREKNVPTNAMVMIQPKLVYVGEPLPLEIGIKNMWQDIHIIYKGPAGTGKTVIAQTLSALLNMPLYTMNGSTDTDSDMIIGSQGASNGSTYVMEGLLVNAMKNAGIFYADEANFVLPEILSVVNAALDHRKEIYNYNNHEHVVGHRNFRFLASINEGYEGTKTMNKATTDRTVSVVVNYMSPKHLKDYLRDYMKKEDLSDFQRNVLKMDQVSEADIILLANIATALQNGVKNQNIGLPQEVASTRNIVQLLRETRTLPFEVAIKTIVQKYDVDVRSAIVSVLENVGRLNLNARDIISA